MCSWLAATERARRYTAPDDKYAYFTSDFCPVSRVARSVLSFSHSVRSCVSMTLKIKLNAYGLRRIDKYMFVAFFYGFYGAYRLFVSLHFFVFFFAGKNESNTKHHCRVSIICFVANYLMPFI